MKAKKVHSNYKQNCSKVQQILLAEILKEASKEESTDGTASTNTDETTVTDDIKDPSEVTAEDLQSPIDIKL